MSSSPSVGYRNSGNATYKLASEIDQPIRKRIKFYQDANNCYNRALQTAADDCETASACKNLGMTYWRLATTSSTNSDAKETRLAAFNFQESVRYLCMAHHKGKEAKDLKWLDGIECIIHTVLQDCLICVSNLDHMERVRAIEKVIDQLHIDRYKAEMYTELAEVVFFHGITAIQNGDFKTGLNNMHRCYFPIEEGRRLARGDESILTKVKTLEEDVFLNKCVAESIQARNTGDILLRQVLEDEEVVNMDQVFVILDWYKQAIILTREKEVECEAIALSQIGHVFDKILFLRSKAKESFMRCMQLANSLHPKTFNLEGWFKQCTEALERFQQEQIRKDELAKQKEKEPYLKELKPELDVLNSKYENREDDEKFLRFVYETHPPKPKAGQAKIDEASLKANAIKKAFLKAIKHYHPDQQKDEHGKKWNVLCEEITKLLTRRYECYKL